MLWRMHLASSADRGMRLRAQSSCARKAAARQGGCPPKPECADYDRVLDPARHGALDPSDPA